MTTIQPTSEPAYWIIETNELQGITIVGNLTIVNSDLTVIFGEGENEFLNFTSTLSSSFNPLPDIGWIEANTIYSYKGSLVICRQSHERTIYPPEQTPALFAVYREDATAVLEWVVGEQVIFGMLRTYKGKTYKCVIPHQTQIDWTPDRPTNLWVEYVDTPDEYKPWVQPVGAHDAIKKGDRRTFEGHLWESRYDGNVWSPAVLPSWWIDLGVYP